MSTYNGEKYLEEQLNSLYAQIDVDLDILVRDDGSSDKTLDILEKYKSLKGLKYYTGDNLKPAKSFLDLINKAEKYDYYAFCDQDDYWLPDKLSSATSILRKFDVNKPALYFSNTTIVDNELKILSDSNQNPNLNFPSSLYKYVAYGCTEVFNYKLVDYLKKYNNKNVKSHDNWIYKVCLALDGNVYFDKKSYILYRQHEQNFIGINNGKIKTIKDRFMNLFKKNNIRNVDSKEILYGYKKYMSQENVNYAEFIAHYKTSFKIKMRLIKSSKKYTRGIIEQLKFILSVILNTI